MVFYIPCPWKSPTPCRRATALQTHISGHLLSGKECRGRGGKRQQGGHSNPNILPCVPELCPTQGPSCQLTCAPFMIPLGMYLHSPALDTTSKKNMEIIIKNKLFPVLHWYIVPHLKKKCYSNNEQKSLSGFHLHYLFWNGSFQTFSLMKDCLQN